MEKHNKNFKISNPEVEFTTELNMNLDESNNCFLDAPSTIEVIEDIMMARDELFENRLKNGFSSHRKVTNTANNSNLPHKS